LTPDGVLIFTTANREYRIRGLTATGLDRLRVNLRLRVNGGFHLDTLDLYQARSRSAFAQAAAKQGGLSEAQIGKDLLELVDRLEAARLQMSPAGSSAKTPEAPMTAPEREAALAYFKAPNLLERIVEDFRACGLIGERSSVLVSYLAAISRKLAKPLSLLIVARTGAGKSSLQDALCSLVPPEEVVRVTRLTGQALFYKDPDSLKNKVLSHCRRRGRGAGRLLAAHPGLRSVALDCRHPHRSADRQAPHRALRDPRPGGHCHHHHLARGLRRRDPQQALEVMVAAVDVFGVGLGQHAFQRVALALAGQNGPRLLH
jgi:hypothetical protein